MLIGGDAAPSQMYNWSDKSKITLTHAIYGGFHNGFNIFMKYIFPHLFEYIEIIDDIGLSNYFT